MHVHKGIKCMFKKKLTAAVVAASIAFAATSAHAIIVVPPKPVPVGGASSGAFGLVGCVLSIMLAAADKGNKYKKELTTEEAATCGLLYWVNEANKRR